MNANFKKGDLLLCTNLDEKARKNGLIKGEVYTFYRYNGLADYLIVLVANNGLIPSLHLKPESDNHFSVGNFIKVKREHKLLRLFYK